MASFSSNSEESNSNQSSSSASNRVYSHDKETAKRRLRKEFAEFKNDESITVSLKDNNLFEWEATIKGPPGSPYEGGKFVLMISFPERYPFVPPKVTFKTKIDHFNINSKGEIGLNILNKNWTPALTVQNVLQSIYRHLSQSSSSNSNGADSHGKSQTENRLEIEFDRFTNDESIRVSLKDNNLYEWEATIKGPPGTPYEGGTFLLDMTFPEDYPFEPPKVTFKTPIYHWNINSKGEVGLDILKKNWTPSLSPEEVLKSIYSHLTSEAISLLSNPTTEKFRETYDRTCKEWTEKFATEKSP